MGSPDIVLPMLQVIELAVALLAVATVVALLARRLKIPYTVFLVVAGLCLGVLRQAGYEGLELLEQMQLTGDDLHDLILLIFLPPLLFEGCLNMDLEILRRQMWPVLLLATVGTFITTGLIGGSLMAAFGFGLAGALLLAAMLAPTDPVSVLALFKEAGVNKDLSTVVEGESVFNDGIAVVLFLIFLQMCRGTEVTVASGLAEFSQKIFLGGGVGLVLGYAAHRILGMIDEHLIEVMISVVLAYGSYVLAEVFHASGVIAVVSAGIIIGNYGRVFSMSATTRLTLSSFWEVAAFLVNSFLFLMMGLATRMDMVFDRAGMIIAIFVGMLLIRSVVTYGAFALLNRYRTPVSRGWQHVINWGGLRGSIPIALVLGLPTNFVLQAGDKSFSQQEITQIISGVVLLSLLVQGLSISWLLHALGFTRVPKIEREYELLRGRTISLKAASYQLEELFAKGEVAPQLHEGLRQQLDAQLTALSGSTESLLNQHYELKETEYRKVAHAMLLAERAAVEEGARQGILSEEALEHLLAEIDNKLMLEEGSPLYAAGQIDDEPDLPDEP